MKKWPLLLLLVFSLAVRIYIYAHIQPRLHTDSITYLILSDLDTIRTPGYSLFIEAVWFVNDLFDFSSNYLRLIAFVQMFILGMANWYLLYRLSFLLTRSTNFSFIVGLLYNTNYLLLGFEFQILSETLAITFLLLTLLFYFGMFDGKKFYPVLAGVFSAFLILVRPVFLLLFCGLAVITFAVHLRQALKGDFLRKSFKPLAVFFLINILGILSWSLRNKIQFDYFGITTMMPYQLRHYTKNFFDKYKKGDDEFLNRLADIYLEENCHAGRFDRRLETELGMTPVEISRVFLKLNLKVIRDNPQEYLRQVPESAADYYQNYSAYWMVPFNKKLLHRNSLLPWVFSFFFNLYSKLYKTLAALLLAVIVLPVLALILVRREKQILHLFLLIAGAAQYNFIISVLSTNSGIDNLRYRISVEPLLLLAFFASLYYLGKKGLMLVKGKLMGVA